MSEAVELLRYTNVATLCTLTLACAWQWRQHREASIRWAGVAFGSIGLVGLLGIVLERQIDAGLVMWLLKPLVIILLLFPYFLYRFSVAFERPTWWMTVLAHLSTAAVVVGAASVPYFPIPGMPEPTWWSLLRVGVLVQWTILFAIVAARLWRAGRREAGIARKRMHTLALAAVGMNVAVLLSSITQGPPSELTRLVTQVLFGAASALFFVGLAPPAWLVALWRRPEGAAMQSVMGELFRSDSQDQLGAVLLPRVVGMVGAQGAALVLRSGELLGTCGTTAAPAEVVRLAIEPAATDQVHRVELRTGTLLLWTSRYAPFFGQADLELISGLGTLVDIVLDRCALANRRLLAEQELAHQALHDALTGLPNRTLLMDRLTQAQAGLGRHGGAVSVLFLDLDRFKLVNDTIDHLAGDALLKQVARRLLGAVRPGDTVARFGGDEFVVVAEVGGESEALWLGGRLIASLEAPFDIGGQDLSITASVGAVVVTARQDPELLVRDADVAMYRAKDAGRGRVALFDEEARLESVNRLGLERDLRAAIGQDELALHYQPVVALADGRVAGVEALLRWQHPTLGSVLPGAFIPLAEESSLIADIGTFAIDAACRQARAWRDELGGVEDLIVWVNVSGAQFTRMDVPAAVAVALKAHELPAHAIGLEITESVFVQHADTLRVALTELRALGVRIAIDDFGTGFSSLGRLKDLPTDVIKIDGCFVRGLGDKPEDAAIVAACVALADALGLIVVAECIETSGQLAALVAEHCHHGQGFHFSPPLPADEATRYLQANRAHIGKRAATKAVLV